MAARILCVICLIAICTGAGPATSPATQPSRSMKVTVVSAIDKTPIAKAEVSVFARKNGKYVTDDQGVCDVPITDDDKDFLSLQARKAGLVPMRAEWNKVQEDDPPPAIPDQFTFEMIPGMTVGGLVTDEAGNPIAKATVHLDGQREYPRTQRYVVRYIPRDLKAVTGDDGRWTCDEIDPDCKSLWGNVTHPDFAAMTDTTPLQLAAMKDQSAVAKLVPGISLEGVVHDSSGNPVAGARIVRGVYEVESNHGKATSDDKGHFAFKHIMPGEQSLVISAKGFAPESRRVTPPCGSLDVTLAPGKTFRARFIDPAGKPISGVSLRMNDWNGVATMHVDPKIDTEGHCVIEDFPTNAVTFDVYAQGFVSLDRKAFAAEEKEIPITLQPETHVHGSVTDSDTGQPIPDFTLIDGGDYGNMPPLWNRGDRNKHGKDGKYQITLNVGYPAFVLRIEADGYVPAVSRSFKQGETDAVWDVQLQHGAGVRGTLHKPNGSPMADAKVMLFEAGWDHDLYSGGGDRDAQLATTGPNGEFQFSPQITRYSLVVMNDTGYAEQMFEPDQTNADVIMRSWGRIEGVFKAGDKPVANEHVSMMIDSVAPRSDNIPKITWQGSVKTDADGHFVWEKVPPSGRWPSVLLMMREAGGRDDRRWISVTVPAGDTVHLEVGGSGRPVIGRMKRPDGFVGDFSNRLCCVVLTTQEVEPWKKGGEFDFGPIGRPHTVWRKSLESDGTFRLDDIPEGHYGIELRAAAGDAAWEASKEFAVDAGTGQVDQGPVDLGTIEGIKFQPLTLGQPVPELKLSKNDGQTLDLATYRGKHVLLVFWNTCTPSLDADAPYIKRVSEAFGGKDGKLAVIGINSDRVSCGMIGVPRGLSSRDDFEWIQGFVDLSNDQLLAKFGVSESPEVLLIDPAGKLLAKDLHRDAIETEVRRAISAK